jgi:hypothetical protein
MARYIYYRIFFCQERRAGIRTKMSRCIYNMFAILHKSTTSCSSFTSAYRFVGKFFSCLGTLPINIWSHKIPSLGIGALKDYPFAVKTEISFSIITAKSQLLIFLKCFSSG